MEGQVKRETDFDFQIALESEKERMNATAPSRFFLVKDYPIWKIVGFGGHGIIYTSLYWEGYLVMLFGEVYKYSIGTEREDKDLLSKGEWFSRKCDYEEGRYFRRKIQKYEVYWIFIFIFN